MKPTSLPVKLAGIAPELKSIEAWVMWRYVQRTKPSGEKVWAKMPMTVEGRAASSTNPLTWTTYGDVVDTLIMDDTFDGIGLVLGADVQGIDLDDCRDLESGELNAFANEVLERVQGYTEVSPSGTGIKVFAKTNLDGSRTKKEVGLELYREGRYFTVTGHVIKGRESISDQVQDLGWLVERVWGEGLNHQGVLEGDAAERALANYKGPIEEWDLDRVVAEVLPHLDPDAGYSDWLRVGAAMHHQGGGDEGWLQAWDEWSALSGKWAEGYCDQKWTSFSAQRATGKGAVTLASLLKQTKDARESSARSSRDVMMADLLGRIESVVDPRDLQEKIAASIANNGDYSDVERAQFAQAIQSRARVLGTKLEIATVRGWLRARVSGASMFPHLNDDGHPLCTIENLEVLLARLDVMVRYNVISKATELLIPDSAFTRDNRENASIAYVLSECEKARMSTKFVPQFLLMLADKNQYNPVATWIESRGWDGVSRLGRFYATVDCGGQMDQGLKELLMRKWLVQAIGAAFEPDGIAAQGILTFTGAQNIGKTTWFMRLAPESLNVVHTGHTLDVRSKDSQLIALRYWIVELGEVDATFRKSDMSALKSFATQAIDTIRRPYAVTESNYGRRTVFGASVNDVMFLADPTGNRRFWTIPVVGFPVDPGLDMQQVWAEVLELYRAGERWYLSMDQAGLLGEHNADFTVVDPIDERIAAGFCWGEGVQCWDWATATEVLMRIKVQEPSKNQTITASRVLQKLNGGQRKKSNGKVLFAIPSAVNEFLG
ncbi:Virulence-associated E [uncultured Caudovirales phage]|uniref:Virulence-associated E n=1 Tax=uncultured Caudovirales phage TaxID=2100421 RepID=A0A6J5RA16_9CAUD|nr:Virulence-associated E [uncultured Caudovirales phage]CAB4190331.1 Virulence-associated E [uncultured Caudovirales phage]